MQPRDQWILIIHDRERSGHYGGSRVDTAYPEPAPPRVYALPAE